MKIIKDYVPSCGPADKNIPDAEALQRETTEMSQKLMESGAEVNAKI